MQTIKYRNKRKAVSPIIATLILIVITVAAGVIIYYFVSGYLSSTTSSAANQETYVITSVIYYLNTTTNPATGYLNVTVYNSGATSINIISAKVLNAAGSVVAYGTVIKNGLVLPGQTVMLNIQLNKSLIKGIVYTLVTTTAQGTQQTFNFKA